MQSVQVCLSELESLSSAATSESRRALLRRLTDLFCATSELQSQSDSAVFGDAIGRVAYDVDEEARAELSKRITKRPNTPRNLALRLANDAFPVARPVLEHTASLTSQDLVSIVKSHGQEHSLAIAKRSALATAVTDVLAARGNEPVLETLAGNHGAEFSRTGFETLVKRAGTNLEINEAISERQDVPTDLWGQVKDNVETGFNEQISDIGGLSLSDIAGEVPRAAEDSGLDPSRAKYRREIDHLHDHGNLSEETVVRFAKARDKLSTAYALSKLLGLAPCLVGCTLVRGSAFAIAIIVKAGGFTRGMLDDLVNLLKSGGTFTPQLLADVRTLHTAIDRQTAQKILRFLKVRMASARAV